MNTFNIICKKLAAQGITSESSDLFNRATWQYVIFNDALESEEKDINSAKEALQRFEETWPELLREIQRDAGLYAKVKPQLDELKQLTDEARNQFNIIHGSKNKPLLVNKLKGNVMFIKRTLTAILFSASFIAPLYAADDLPTLFYQCGKKEVMVNYHDGDKLDLTIGHTTYIMHVVPSGSGAKYETDKAYKPFVEYWNKGDKITIDIDGKALPKCRKVKAKK